MYKNLQKFIIGSLILITACGEPSKRDEESDSDATNIEAVEAAAPQVEQREKAFYPIPSPEQMFSFISDAGIQYSKDLINDPNVSKDYVDPIKKALNFGVYTADLAYAAAYRDIESTIELYKVVKRLGSEMNISEMMTSETLDKIQANMEEPDSLAVIAGDAYYQAVDYLEANEQNGKLALMSLGGWIESLYIILNSVQEIDAKSSTTQRIADQKITFGNLYTYLKKNENETGVADAINDIKNIRSVFASLVEEKKASQTTSKEGKKLVFGKGSKINITEAQYIALKEAINAYRAKIIA